MKSITRVTKRKISITKKMFNSVASPKVKLNSSSENKGEMGKKKTSVFGIVRKYVISH